jgi:hypothetical protein
MCLRTKVSQPGLYVGPRHTDKNVLESDGLEIPARGVDEERFAESDDTLLDTGAGPLDHNVVILDNTVVRLRKRACQHGPQRIAVVSDDARSRQEG